MSSIHNPDAGHLVDDEWNEGDGEQLPPAWMEEAHDLSERDAQREYNEYLTETGRLVQ